MEVKEVYDLFEKRFDSFESNVLRRLDSIGEKLSDHDVRIALLERGGETPDTDIDINANLNGNNDITRDKMSWQMWMVIILCLSLVFGIVYAVRAQAKPQPEVKHVPVDAPTGIEFKEAMAWPPPHSLEHLILTGTQQTLTNSLSSPVKTFPTEYEWESSLTESQKSSEIPSHNETGNSKTTPTNSDP